MTRKEQIEKASKLYDDLGEQHAFTQGAKWTDANPLLNVESNIAIGELIHQRSIAFDEARDAREKLSIAVEALEKILPEYAETFDSVSIEMGSSITHEKDETYLATKEALAKIT